MLAPKIENELTVRLNIEQINEIDFKSVMKVYDTEGEVDEEYGDTYKESNSIYPLYNTLMIALNEMNIFDTEVTILTNSETFAKELSGVPNTHTTLLRLLNLVREYRNLRFVTVFG